MKGKYPHLDKFIDGLKNVKAEPVPKVFIYDDGVAIALFVDAHTISIACSDERLNRNFGKYIESIFKGKLKKRDSKE